MYNKCLFLFVLYAIEMYKTEKFSYITEITVLNITYVV